MALVESLGVPWHPTKTGTSFTDIFIFIGFLWDLIHRRVSLPEKKRLKFLQRVADLLLKASQGEKVSLRDIQIIHGSLIHVAFIHQDGSSRLPAFSNFMSRFCGNEFATYYLPRTVTKALKWWHAKLSDPTAFRQLFPRGTEVDLGIFVDASTSWGIGIIIGESWFAFELREDWKMPGRDICWLEAVALEFLVYFLIQLDFCNVRLLIHSDNNGAIGAHSKGRSRNVAINLCVRRTYSASSSAFISTSFKYIESALNPSDPISRGELGPSSTRLVRRFKIPRDLRTFFVLPDD
jgi:hypothetical protein